MDRRSTTMRTFKLSLAAVLFAATVAVADTDLEVQFVQLDADSDGFVALSEWTGGSQTFESLDRDGDAVVTRNEFFTQGTRYKSREENFRDLDADKDGRVSASEWKWGEQTMSVLDRNGDGFLSRQEFRCHPAGGRTAQQAGGR
ncbi:MAG TPA: EF-hand domain-containing protein [Thermoanaerobaculia bacterium]|nr:EF-hand domain-containing protein [Thermoanaerobaculia bacterium]